jgi:hypothetical protein
MDNGLESFLNMLTLNAVELLPAVNGEHLMPFNFEKLLMANV